MTEYQVIQRVITFMQGEDGYMEKASNKDLYDKTANAGSGNYTKYWAELKPSYQTAAWCQAFQNWCFYKLYGAELGKKMLCIPDGEDWTYYTPTAANYFKQAKRWTTTPQVGALVYFKNSVRIHHVAMVTKVTDSYIYTCEGNTSPSNGTVIPNGGQVVNGKRYLRSSSTIAGYGIPKYYLAAEKDPELVESNISTGIDGLKIVVSGSINVRDYPVTGNVVYTLKNGARIYPTKKTYINGSPWIYIGNGWISANYVEGWIKENDGRWWYVMKDYSWVSSGKQTIDDVDYYFDADGYLVENKMFELDGEKVYVKYGGELAKKEWVQVGSDWYYAKDNATLATSEFILLDHNGATELFYFKDDSTMYTGELKLKTNERGALTL